MILSKTLATALIFSSYTWGQGLPKSAPLLSRPDLLPSEFNVTLNEKDSVHDGYIFLASWIPKSFPREASYLGPHVYDSEGKLTWTGYGGPNVVVNFMPIEGGQANETKVSYFEGVPQDGFGTGTYRIMDSSYRAEKTLGRKSPYLHDFHEFQYGSNNTAVFTTYQTSSFDFSDIHSSMKNGWIYNGIVTDIDTETDEVKFTWNSIDHVPVKETVVLGQLGPSAKGQSSENVFDYLHMNSVVKDEHGNYLISGRHTWSVYYVDGTTGDIIWTINSNPKGKKSNWDIDHDARFAWQHHPRWVSPSYIGEKDQDNVRYLSLFDNEQGGTPQGFRNYSRGVILKLTTYNNSTFQTKVSGKIGKVELLHEYKPSGAIPSISATQGSVQVLDNGNVFVGWGATPGVTEYKLDGTKVFEAVPRGGLYGSYRAFKGSWSAVPFQQPALKAESFVHNSSTVLYFSWNGATGVSYYNVYGGNSTSSLSQISKVQKKGFEDGYTANGLYKYIKIEAASKGGEVLGEYTTSPVVLGDPGYYKSSNGSF